MSEIYVFLITLPLLAIISYFWVRGIDYMQKHHPNYKGEDLI